MHISYNARCIVTVFIFLFLSGMISYGQYEAQKEANPPIRERIFYGGSFGLQFGTIANIEVSPVVGIWLLPRLAVAAGPKYRYYKDPLGKTDIYGARSFARFMFIQDLSQFIPLGMRMGFYVHGEYEALSLRSDFWKSNYNDDSRFWEHTTLAGLGMSQLLGRRASVNITLMWSLTESEYQIYDNPEIRIDFIF
ncbi:MAG: hypothetical protein R6V34_07530 [Bacteroidales bacterium]